MKVVQLCLAALLLAGSGRALAQESAGRIVGTVVDQATRQPIGGATVQVVGSPQAAVSDPAGRFTVADVPTGTRVLRISAPGYRPREQLDVAVGSAQPVQVRVELAGAALALEGLVVQPAFSVAPGLPTSAYKLGSEEVRRSPGALGDINRLIQSLPGVVPTNDQRNDLVVRGGSPIENLTLLDNVEVPSLSHFNAQGASGGPISMLNTDLILDAEFLAGGFPVQYGNRLSSVLDVTLREGSRDRFASTLDFGFAGAGAILEGPIGGNASWVGAVKRSYLDLIIGAVGFTAVPKFTNYQFKVSADPSARDRLWLITLGGTDDIHFEVDHEDTEDPSLLDIRSGSWRTINGLNWQRLLGSRGYGILAVSDVYASYDQRVHDSELDDQLVFANDSRERETTVKYDLAYRLGIGEARAGLSSKRFGSVFEVDQPFGVQNEYSAERPRTDPRFIDDRSAAFLHAGYLQLTRSFAERVDLTLGGRYDYFTQSSDGRVGAQAGLKYHLRQNLSWSASAGRYHQIPPLVYFKAAPGNAALEPIRADHYVTGLSFFPGTDLLLGLEAYLKRYADYPVSLEHPTLSLANAGDEFNVASLLMPYASSGTGRAVGLELHLQKKLTGRTYGQLSYSLSRTRHRALDGVDRPSSFDIPHVLSVIAGYKPSQIWELSGRFSFATGRPYTPLDLAASEAQNRPILDLARVNDARSPAYHRLDLHGERRVNFRGWSLTGFMDLQNVYNRENVFQYIWNPKTRERVAVNQISFLPVGGFLIKF